MEKKYQVFVSSTYEDLKEERKAITQALLESNCIPAGMELFPASNKTSWDIIKKVIDESKRYSKEEIDSYATLVPIVADFIEANNLFSEGRSIGELTKHYIRENLSKKIKESSLNSISIPKLFKSLVSFNTSNLPSCIFVV